MGTVLSFSPRERRPVYSTHHHSSGGVSSSGSADFPLNNYSYEQLNNVKNRENNKPANCQIVPNNTNIALMGQNNNHHHNNNGNNNIQDRQSDSARILSEKNALEKNLKKHSLFINALSWKRLAASHGKKKLDNNKNKTANLTTATFRPPLADAIHPLVVDKNKNIQQQQSVYFTPGAPPKTLLALDLVRANNTNPLQQPDKLATKLPLSLPLPLQSAINQQTQHSHGPRKTVIQVISFLFSINNFMNQNKDVNCHTSFSFY